MDNFMERYNGVFHVGESNCYRMKSPNEKVGVLKKEFFDGLPKEWWKLNLLIQVYVYAIIYNEVHRVAFKVTGKEALWNGVQSFVLLAQDIRIDLSVGENEQSIIWIGNTGVNRNIFSQQDKEVGYFLFDFSTGQKEILHCMDENILYANQVFKVNVTSYTDQRFVRISTTMDSFQLQSELVRMILGSQVIRVTIVGMQEKISKTYIFVRK